MDEENYKGNGNIKGISVMLAGIPAVIRTTWKVNLECYSRKWILVATNIPIFETLAMVSNLTPT
jgi:hypothetical protein